MPRLQPLVIHASTFLTCSLKLLPPLRYISSTTRTLSLLQNITMASFVMKNVGPLSLKKSFLDPSSRQEKLPAVIGTGFFSSGAFLSSKSLTPSKFSSRLFAAAEEPATNSDDDVAVSDVEPLAVEELEEVLKAQSEPVSGSIELKQGLLDTVEGTNRGINASSEVRAEITELIAQLEANNPTSAPTEAAELLDGKWILAYTSLSELYPLLALGYLPLVDVGEISQTIDASAGILTNKITFSNPVSKSTVATEASYEVRSAKRIQVKFQETVLSPPEAVEGLEAPKSISLFGRQIDLSNADALLKPVQDAASTIIRSLSGQPPIKVPFRNEKASSWLLTTYLDEDLRIARGDGGGVFVLVKEGSPLVSSL